MKKFFLFGICSVVYTAVSAQSFTDSQLEKIRNINTNIVNVAIRSPLGFKDIETGIRQEDNGTEIYDAKEIPGLYAQQYYVTEVPAKFRNVYMAYYSNADDITLVTAAVTAAPAFGGSKWTLRAMPATHPGETNEDILLAGVKVGNFTLQAKENTALLCLGFYEDPRSVPAAPVKEEPKVTAKCASGNCQTGKGELVIFDKKGILTDRLTGEFGGGQFINGTHYKYGTGLSPASFEKEEGSFQDFVLTQGVVTLSGYKLTDSVFDTKTYTPTGNCISGDCVNGTGKLLIMKPAFGASMIIIYDGLFKNGAFLSGSAFMDGVDSLFDGSYSIKNFHYRNARNQAFADAVFMPKGYSEPVKGTWTGEPTIFKAVPFYLSDDYFHRDGRFIGRMKTKDIPAWITDVYNPISTARSNVQRAEAEANERAALLYDMKIHPNDYKTDNSYSNIDHTCSCCNGSGSVGSGRYYMNREIPKKCGCCGGTGKRY